ncbi:GH15 family glucan-1,4-alpha-glucosidase [Kribbella antiqua]|uniref:GH15 family glucan-1,4-alpha-glucosidase n=1 Tax=Kribbella antiqua TaxID=2512217 RepID=A0A4R2IDV4_9ACTN|nr:glycoside hydrolase family 15 protein [Kribbella antiqua]TCO42372.1 GH15 family glucan-1,4-alpha-glucosidase [Kribbella antiqua]
MTHIEDYALIGDLRTAALVAADGSIDWLCLPRFDSAAVFAALLGNPSNGRWTLGPATGGRCARRCYRGDSLILDTDWVTSEGQVRVTDFMPPTGPVGRVVRIVEGVVGRVRMHTSLGLRMDYGRVVPVHRSFGSQNVAIAGPDSVWLSTSIGMAQLDNCLIADFTVVAGERLSFVLTHTRTSQVPPPADTTCSLAATAAYWNRWISRCTYTGPWADAVRRSLVILKALTHAPTGSILAAATTSLPEHIGGTRIWDYRYCWLRDASFTLQAFQATGYVEEVIAWRDWLGRTVADDPSDVQIMYGLDGARRLPERTLDWLSGYRSSAPVRVGNAAARQVQNDVWGEALDALCGVHTADAPHRDTDKKIRNVLLEHLEDGWQEPDNGIWEVRGPRRHFVHSKAMAWVGVDRAVRALEHEKAAPETLQRLRNLRRTMHDEICHRGFSAALRSFTQCYGSSRLDASVLLLPRYGFLPWTDSRMVSTVDAIQANLTRDGLIMRYAVGARQPNCDGIQGNEGVFLACSFWLTDALHGIGRTDEAEALFDRLLSLRNDVGLLSEEYDVATGHHLGNTPQAFSHAGLVTTALHLSRQRRDKVASSSVASLDSAAS